MDIAKIYHISSLSFCDVLQEELEVEAPTIGSMEDLEGQSLDQKLQMLRGHRDWKCNVKWEVRRITLVFDRLII